MISTRSLRIPALLAAIVLGLAGCGAEDGAGSTTSSSAKPTAPVIPEVTDATDYAKKPVPAAAGADAPRPTELLTKDLITGKGTAATLKDTVNVRYVGTRYSDGEEFDASWKSGDEPVTFPLSGVVPGFAQGIVGMTPGGRRTIVIPSELGYGSTGSGADIPPDTDLVFVVDLVSIGAG